MDWKERRTERRPNFARRIGRFAMFLLMIGLIAAAVTNALDVVDDIRVYGWKYQEFWRAADLSSTPYWQTAAWMAYQARANYAGFASAAGCWLAFFLLVGVATSAASSITSEREADTWTSLTTTLLTGREILRAKVRGVLWSARFSLLLVILLWLSGVLLICLHPLGFLLSTAQLLVYAWFAAVLGATISLMVKSTLCAQLLTIGAMIFFNVLGQGVLNAFNWMAPQLWIGFMPGELAKTLWSVPEFFNLFRCQPPSLNDLRSGGYGLERHPIWNLILSVLCLFAYLGLGVWMFRWANGMFDRIVGRPARPNKVLDTLKISVEAA